AMPVDAFTGLVLGSESRNPFPGLAENRPGWAPSPLTDVHIGGAVMWVGGAGIMFGLVMAVFFAWSREKRADAGLGWLEAARRSNFATLVTSHEDGSASAGPGPASTASPASPAAAQAPARDRETVDDDEHLAAYNAYLARINKPQDS
ncbi:MAG TPA: cytochrome c oxidase assembly protein, partial [Streptosporangiaceae bacterium]|nr:cytochrome c oxidase assembly protein [Streptosporangiaceae bacterium]